MRSVIFITALIFITVLQGFGQSKLVPTSKSQLTGIELPAQAKQDNRILSTASAKTLLQMKAEEGGLTIGEQVEVFTMPPSDGSQTVDQIKAAAQKAGWEIRPFTKEVTYSLLVNKQHTLLMYLESTKKETAFYVAMVFNPPSIAPVKSETKTEAIVQPTQTQVQPKEQTQTQIVAPVAITKQTQSTTTQTDSNTTSTTPSENTGYTFNTINFDDGWTSIIATDYVKVVKGNTEVLLYYSSAINDQMRDSNIDMRDYFWNLLVVPNYTIKSSFPLNESLSYIKVHFTEGEAIDHAGKPVYLAMSVLVNSGIASPILVIAPDKNSYYQQFPEPKNLGNMLGYNRFAIGLKDVVGDWSANSGSSVSLYNVYTGNYAGMNYTQSSDSFTFNNDGTYSSKHSGASGVYGTNTVYQQEYKGKLTVSNWEMSMTNRWKDATETFNASFEVVRGGRVLHLQDKKASGIVYHLVKVK